MSSPVFGSGALTRESNGSRTSRDNSAAASACLFSPMLAFLHLGHQAPQARLVLSSGTGKEITE